jgi:hypothetical protein
MMDADNIDGPVCWFCGNTEELSPRERAFDSAPLGGWECKECLDAEREYRVFLEREEALRQWRACSCPDDERDREDEARRCDAKEGF